MRTPLPLLVLLLTSCSSPSGVDEARVAALEKDLDNALAANATLEARVAALEAVGPTAPYDDTSIVGAVEKLTTRLTAAEATLDPVPQALETLTAADTALDERVVTVEEQLPPLSSQLSALSDAVDAVSDKHGVLAKKVDPAAIDCPEDMLEAEDGGFCFDETANGPTAFWGAAFQCYYRGAHVCDAAEWMAACVQQNGASLAKLMVREGIECRGADVDAEDDDSSHPYRCCRDKANLVYGKQPDE